MQESAAKRMATVEVIRGTINDLSSLIDKQAELAGSEIREGASNVLNGVRILIVGFAGLLLMVMALTIAVILALSLLIARAGLFLMAKGYQSVKAIEGGLQGWHAKRHPTESTATSEAREAA